MTDTLFSLNNRSNLLAELKEKAPIIYEKYKARKIHKINEQLVFLRMDYKGTEDVEKRNKIIQKANDLKEELKQFDMT